MVWWCDAERCTPHTAFYGVFRLLYRGVAGRAYEGSESPPYPPEKIAAIEAAGQNHIEELLRQPEPDETVQAKDGSVVEKVPQRNSWLVDGEDFIGNFNVRLRLSSFLEVFGGHIGYGIRQSRRGRGYATQGLHLALQILRNEGIYSAVITADQENVASCRVIESNGGRLRDVQTYPWHPKPLCRYDVPTDLTSSRQQES